jgi:hypothetical protein
VEVLLVRRGRFHVSATARSRSTNPLVSLAAIPGTFDRVWIASLEPPLSVRAEGSEERTLLYACARFDRFVSMHLVRRTDMSVSALEGSAACDADPPRLFELEEPFPSAEPISDAPCRSAGTTASVPMHRPVAVETHAFAHASSSPAQPGCFRDHPVRGGRFRTRSAFHRAAPPRPCGLGCGHLLGIRPPSGHRAPVRSVLPRQPRQRSDEFFRS